MSTNTRQAQVMEGETGFVTRAKGYLLTLEGLPSARVNTIIANRQGERAIVSALREQSVEAYLLDRGSPKAGEQFIMHPKGIQFSLGDHLFGRALNVLGEPIDGQGNFPAANSPLRMEEALAPGMSARESMTEQLITGMPAIDILLPIAKGQRQLVVGPISSGKTLFLESVLAHQQSSDVVCIYAFIGRPVSYIEEAVAQLLGPEGNPRTIVLATFSDDPAPMVYLTPIVALQIAEYFSWDGKDVVLVLDDLGSHAKYFREIALLAGEVPGRESYPGDMFFQQARLLERGGRFNKTLGSGSITILPVLETNIEDLTNLLSTNMVSATDGHLFFSPLYHSEGFFPAVVPKQSVTRVGHNTQSKLAKQLSIQVHALIADYERQRRYSQFGSQLSEETRRTIARGEILSILLDQEPSVTMALETQIVLLSLVFTTAFDERDADAVRRNRAALVEAIQQHSAFKAVVTSAQRGDISLEQFLKKLTGIIPQLEVVWQAS